MSAWLIIGLVWAVLWLFWVWLGALFDAISDYHHHYSKAASNGEDAQATKGKGSC